MKKTRLDDLLELREMASFVRANFDHPGDPAEIVLKDGDKKYEKVTAFIKERTDLYMRTWVLPKIDALIQAEQEYRASRKKRVR